VAQFAPLSKLPQLGFRVRGVGGVGLETTTGYGSGVGYDAAGEGEVVYGLIPRLRILAGGGLRRTYTQYSGAPQANTSVIEARRAVWLGAEAAF